MLATLAMKKRWQNKRKAAGKPYDKPNIVMNAAVQVCWEKAARYFDVEEKYVYCTPDRYVIDPKEAVDLVDENTIGICAILGTTYTGEYGMYTIFELGEALPRASKLTLCRGRQSHQRSFGRAKA